MFDDRWTRLFLKRRYHAPSELVRPSTYDELGVPVTTWASHDELYARYAASPWNVLWAQLKPNQVSRADAFIDFGRDSLHAELLDTQIL